MMVRDERAPQGVNVGGTAGCSVLSHEARASMEQGFFVAVITSDGGIFDEITDQTMAWLPKCLMPI
ncbi:MAG: hypothetical protein ACI3XD_07165 [Oscillospiraceae bacterium]